MSLAEKLSKFGIVKLRSFASASGFAKLLIASVTTDRDVLQLWSSITPGKSFVWIFQCCVAMSLQSCKTRNSKWAQARASEKHVGIPKPNRRKDEGKVMWHVGPVIYLTSSSARTWNIYTCRTWAMLWPQLRTINTCHERRSNSTEWRLFGQTTLAISKRSSTRKPGFCKPHSFANVHFKKHNLSARVRQKLFNCDNAVGCFSRCRKLLIHSKKASC